MSVESRIPQPGTAGTPGTPSATLPPGPKGLPVLGPLLELKKDLLGTGYRAMLEFGDGQAEPIGRIFSNADWRVESVEEDYSHRPRILIARWPEK